VISAADAWNDNTNAGTFRFVDIMTTDVVGADGGLPLAKADCDAAGINYNLVRTVNCIPPPALAVARARCMTIPGNVFTATRWQIDIAKHGDPFCFVQFDSGGTASTENNYTTGGVVSGKPDLQSVLTHEFGHATGLHHTAGAGWCTWYFNSPASGTARCFGGTHDPDADPNTAPYICTADADCNDNDGTCTSNLCVGGIRVGQSCSISRDCQVNAVMHPQAVSGSTRTREPYQYDLDCLEVANRPRAVRPMSLRRSVGGSWGSSSWLSPTQTPIPYAVDAALGQLYWSPTQFGVDQAVFGRGIPNYSFPAGIVNPPSNWVWQAVPSMSVQFYPPIGPAVGHDSQALRSRVFYSTSGDSVDGNSAYGVANSRHELRMFDVDNFSYPVVEIKAAKFCTCESLNHTCNTSSPGCAVARIDSGHNAAAAKLDRVDFVAAGTGPSLVAIVSQNRGIDSNEVYISVGSRVVGATTARVFGKLLSLGVKSSVGVGLACKNQTSYDCIVAYVDPSDASKSVRIKRFDVTVCSGDNYCLSVESTFQTVSTNVRSGSRLAVTYQDETGTVNDKFWLAVRPIRTTQNMELYSSPAGQTWTPFFLQQIYSPVGPTANQIVMNNTPVFGYVQ
jgi:hypothetical protein